MIRIQNHQKLKKTIINHLMDLSILENQKINVL